jgi:predicted small secreted protein
MKVRGIVVVAMLLALLTVTLSLSGCNTWHGAGKDVQNAGESMQGS